MTDKVIDVVAAVIRRGDEILLASRPADKPPAGWEFPGGKVEAGESLFAATVRELDEELGVAVEPRELMETVCSGRIRLHFVAAAMPDSAVPVPREHQKCFWVKLLPEPPELLLPADREFWKRLAATNKKS